MSCTRGKSIGWSVSKIVICFSFVFSVSKFGIIAITTTIFTCGFLELVSERKSGIFGDHISKHSKFGAKLHHDAILRHDEPGGYCSEGVERLDEKGIEDKASASVRAGERMHGHLFNDRRETTFVKRDGIARREIPTTGLRTRTRNPLQTSLRRHIDVSSASLRRPARRCLRCSAPLPRALPGTASSSG